MRVVVSTGAMLWMFSSLIGAGAARAGSLKGLVQFPPPLRDERASPRPLSLWRLDNGIVPPLPSNELRGEAVVILEPVVKPAIPPRPLALELVPLHLEPHIAVAQAGVRVSFRNDDKRPRTLWLKDGDVHMPRAVTQPGASREVMFTEPGEYHIVDADYPHGGSIILIVSTPYGAIVDDKGGYTIEAPDGKYILKAFFRGAWNEGQSVEVGRSKDVLIKLGAQDKSGVAPSEKP